MTRHRDLVVGLAHGDDAGVYRIAPDRALVQTVDFFTPVVDEPRAWGRIAAANALSDVYAMGGRPLTALQLVGWPRDRLPFSVLAEVLEGAAEVLEEAGVVVVGGHSVDDPEPKFGLAVTGEVHPERVVTNVGGRPGDVLVLTKPLGTGIVATAIKRGAAPPDVVAMAVEMMAALNAPAAEAMVAVGVDAATDVTGYGLLGHLSEMLRPEGLGARVDVARVPVLPGVVDLLAEGFYPGGSVRNLEAVAGILEADGVDESAVRILADAQTSGGLLIAVPAERADALLEALRRRGVEGAPIGVLAEGPTRIALR